MPDYNILELIDRARPGLRRGSRQVAEYILANLGSISDINLAELARNAQVSEPTVLRFCATLGCSCFKDFKIRMVQSLALGAPATHSVLAKGEIRVLVGAKAAAQRRPAMSERRDCHVLGHSSLARIEPRASRDLAARRDHLAEFLEKFSALRQNHAGKPSLQDRFRKAGLS